MAGTRHQKSMGKGGVSGLRKSGEVVWAVQECTHTHGKGYTPLLHIIVPDSWTSRTNKHLATNEMPWAKSYKCVNMPNHLHIYAQISRVQYQCDPFQHHLALTQSTQPSVILQETLRMYNSKHEIMAATVRTSHRYETHATRTRKHHKNKT